MSMKIVPVSALSDNYMYLVSNSEGKAFVVDPVEPDKLIEAAQKNNLTITHALTTHHHHDHAGGNEYIAKKIQDIEVVGGDDRIPAMTKKVSNGDELQVGDMNIKVYFTPCHTSGHVLYHVIQGDSAGVIFTGDTLFIGGCGRFFEGTAEQMHHALNTVIAGLPDSTKVYCGHEYTAKNLEFAQHIEPSNEAVQQKLEWAKAQGKNGAPTVPSTVGEEKTFNPFMRLGSMAFSPSLDPPPPKDKDPVAVMDYLRNLKNKF